MHLTRGFQLTVIMTISTVMGIFEGRPSVMDWTYFGALNISVLHIGVAVRLHVPHLAVTVQHYPRLAVPVSAAELTYLGYCRHSSSFEISGPRMIFGDQPLHIGEANWFRFRCWADVV